MSYSIKKLPDEPIVIVDMADFDISKDFPPYLKEVRDIFDNLTEKTHIITDTLSLTVNFSGIVDGLAKLTRGDNLFGHSNAGRMILVTDSNLIQMGAKVFEPNQYGSFVVEVYETLDEALAAARAE